LDQRGDKLAVEFAEFAAVYRDCATRGVELFSRILLHNKAVMAARNQQPEGMAEVLQRVAFDITIRLFDWDSGKELWPVEVSLGAAYAATMSVGFDPRYSGEWWKVQQQDRERSDANAAKWEEEDAQRQAEEKRRFEESFRGRQA
jgi:hypothetical protein